MAVERLNLINRGMLASMILDRGERHLYRCRSAVPWTNSD
jgi:hypothetical protein